MAYARARWYDARNASWLQEDPVGEVDSTNLYAFVGHQPSMATDPLGLYSWREFGRDLEFAADVALFTNANVIDPRNYWKNTQRAAGGLVGTLKFGGETAIGIGSLVLDTGPLLWTEGAQDRLAQRAIGLGEIVANPVDTVTGSWNRMVANVEAHEAAGDYFSSGLEAGEWGAATGATVIGAAQLGAAVVRAGELAVAAAEAGALARSPVNWATGSGNALGLAGDVYRGFRLRALHSSVVAEVDAAIGAGNTRALTQLSGGRVGWVRSVVGRNAQFAANRGNIIDVAVKARASNTFGLRGLQRTRIGAAGPDFWNVSTMRAWDMTTAGGWGQHLNSYVLGARTFARPAVHPVTGNPIPRWRSLSPLVE